MSCVSSYVILTRFSQQQTHHHKHHDQQWLHPTAVILCILFWWLILQFCSFFPPLHLHFLFPSSNLQRQRDNYQFSALCVLVKYGNHRLKQPSANHMLSLQVVITSYNGWGPPLGCIQQTPNWGKMFSVKRKGRLHTAIDSPLSCCQNYILMSRTNSVIACVSVLIYLTDIIPTWCGTTQSWETCCHY